MTFPTTLAAQQQAKKITPEPQLVLEIEGFNTLIGAVDIFQNIRVGDPGLYVGDTWKIGGLRLAVDQADVISFDGGTSTTISQQLQPDRGAVSSVSSVQVAITDRNLIGSKLMSPGVDLSDILGANATLWMGFKNSAFKEDYIPIFRGFIDAANSSSGLVVFNLASPDQLKRQTIFTPLSLLVAAGNVTDVQTTIPLVDASGASAGILGGIYQPQNGPSGAPDPAITYYVKIEDEVIEYTGVSGNTLTGCTRGMMGTLPVAHVSDGTMGAATLVQLADTMIDCALKFMLSGVNDFYVKALPITRYLHPSSGLLIPNSIYFNGVDLNRDYGVVIGDYITISGATNGANNCSGKLITDVVQTDSGSYAVVGGVAFVTESPSTAVVSIRSQYDSLGYGLGMLPKDVDILEHLYWQDFQLAGYQYRFVFNQAVDGKNFLDQQVYFPVGAFSLPRQGRASMGYLVGPVIRGNLVVLNRDNIKDPDKIRLSRTINRNFYNTVVYQFDVQLGGDYASGALVTDEDSVNRIKVGTKAFIIKSDGMRRALDGQGIAQRVAARYLGRYKFAAEFIEALGALFGAAYTLEPGDVVMLDPSQLKITNSKDGSRTKPAKLFCVMNKSLNLKTGDCVLSITDANFDETEHYGSVSPSSDVVGYSSGGVTIKDSYGAIFPGNESHKWADYIGLPILLHDVGWTYSEEVTLLGIDPTNSYRLLITNPVGTHGPGDVLDVAQYPTSSDPGLNSLYKAAHAFLSKTVAVVGTGTTTTLDVGADISHFTAGDAIRVHSFDYSDDSGEVVILSIAGTVITLAAALGFTPTIAHVVDNTYFDDHGRCYRIF